MATSENFGFIGMLGWQQALPWNLGAVVNYTYTDGKTSSGAEMVGNSKNTYNVEAYYDDDTFSTRLAYTYRSAFLAGLNSSFAQHEDAVGTLHDVCESSHRSVLLDVMCGDSILEPDKNVSGSTIRFHVQRRESINTSTYQDAKRRDL